MGWEPGHHPPGSSASAFTGLWSVSQSWGFLSHSKLNSPKQNKKGNHTKAYYNRIIESQAIKGKSWKYPEKKDWIESTKEKNEGRLLRAQQGPCLDSSEIKEKPFYSRIVYPANPFFTNKGKVKTVDRQKLREFGSSSLHYKECWREFIKREGSLSFTHMKKWRAPRMLNFDGKYEIYIFLILSSLKGNSLMQK